MGDAAMQEMIRRLSEVSEVPNRAAPKVARASKAELASSAAQGLDPQGRPWKKTKDGRTPLTGAGEAIRATATRNVVVLSISDHHARHHLGAVTGGKKGNLRRPILPTIKKPEAVTRAIKAVIVEEGRKVLVEGG